MYSNTVHRALDGGRIRKLNGRLAIWSHPCNRLQQLLLWKRFSMSVLVWSVTNNSVARVILFQANYFWASEAIVGSSKYHMAIYLPICLSIHGSEYVGVEKLTCEMNLQPPDLMSF